MGGRGDPRVSCGCRVVAPVFGHGGNSRWWSTGDEVRLNGGGATRRWPGWQRFGAGRSMAAQPRRRGGATVSVTISKIRAPKTPIYRGFWSRI
jgi:hypothetical protein